MEQRELPKVVHGLDAARKGKRAAAEGLQLVTEAKRALMHAWKPIMSTARANDNRKEGRLRNVT
ncbi:MAG: hypothetical protein RLZZ234_753 [Candidatus Parcubacteria bacterium]